MAAVEAVQGKAKLTRGDAVLELLRREARLFGELETLAGKQRGLIARDDSAALIELLGRRRALSVELEKIGRHLAPFRRNWKTLSADFPVSQRVQAEKLNAEFSSRLQRILRHDERDAQLLQARKTMVAGELRSTRSTKVALSAYQTAGVGARGCGRLDEAS